MIPDSSISEIDYDNHRLRIESLGCVVNKENTSNFERILYENILSGVFDITHWTTEAVVALLKICAMTNQKITLKHGSRYLMPIHYPQGPMLENFAKSIISGEF